MRSKEAQVDDPLDAELVAAGVVLVDDPEIDAALATLARARAYEAGRRRRRVVLPAFMLGSALALAGTVGVAATQWGPWEVVHHPDVVITRD